MWVMTAAGEMINVALARRIGMVSDFEGETTTIVAVFGPDDVVSLAMIRKDGADNMHGKSAGNVPLADGCHPRWRRLLRLLLRLIAQRRQPRSALLPPTALSVHDPRSDHARRPFPAHNRPRRRSPGKKVPQTGRRDVRPLCPETRRWQSRQATAPHPCTRHASDVAARRISRGWGLRRGGHDDVLYPPYAGTYLVGVSSAYSR